MMNRDDIIKRYNMLSTLTNVEPMHFDNDDVVVNTIELNFVGFIAARCT